MTVRTALSSDYFKQTLLSDAVKKSRAAEAVDAAFAAGPDEYTSKSHATVHPPSAATPQPSRSPAPAQSHRL